MRWVMVALAAVTCPCHLPILLAVSSGTALGALLAADTGWTLLALTLLFVGAAWGAVRLFSKSGSVPARRAR